MNNNIEHVCKSEFYKEYGIGIINNSKARILCHEISKGIIKPDPDYLSRLFNLS